MSAIPAKWEQWRLADTGTWSGGGTPSSGNSAYWGGDVPWVSPKDMKVPRITTTQDYITPEAIDNSAAKLIPAHSVLFVTRSGILAHSFPVATNQLPVAVNQDLKVITPVDVIDAEFLAWLLRSRTREVLHTCSKHGTTVHSIEVVALKDVRIPVPPLPEQRRIVAKIEELFSEIDNAVASLTAARDQLKTYRQALLKHAFEGKLTADWRAKNPEKAKTPAPGDVEPIQLAEQAGMPDHLPDGWILSRLGRFITSIEAGNSFKCEEREPTNDEIGVAKVSAVSWGEYDETESKTCMDPERVHPERFIRNGDFLLSRANTIELVGACVVARHVSKRVMLSDKTLRLNISGGNKHFLLYYLRSVYGRAEIERRSTGNQESMRNIGQDRIKRIVVPICSVLEMDEVADRLEHHLDAFDRLEEDLRTHLAQADQLRQSILKRAFSGQLVPKDPNDEPASVLLERIKSERAKAAPPKKKRAPKRKEVTA